MLSMDPDPLLYRHCNSESGELQQDVAYVRSPEASRPQCAYPKLLYTVSGRCDYCMKLSRSLDHAFEILNPNERESGGSKIDRRRNLRIGEAHEGTRTG